MLSSLLAEGELSDVLSNDKRQLLEYQKEQNSVKSEELERSWINPVVLQYSQNYSTQFGATLHTGQFVVSVDQPIFKSGGIWSAIEYSKALGKANELDIELQKRQLISQALTTLYTLEKSKYQLEKLELLLRNDRLDIEMQKENFEAGLTNRTLYDQALLKRNRDDTSKLDLELTISKLESDFRLLSDRDPHTIALPNFSMMDKNRYLQEQIELKRDGFRVEEKRSNKEMTLSKYLPEISLTGRYIDEDLNPLFSSPNSTIKERYFNYGFKVTLPININTFRDIENSKIAYLNAQVARNDKRRVVENNYKLIQKRLEIIKKKIELSEEDAEHYQSMLMTTQAMEELGDKTNFDTEIVTNNLKVRELDQEIYKLDAQIELLQLYVNVADAL